MRHLVRLTDWTVEDVTAVFALADAYAAGRGPQRPGCAVLFFPPTSLRTRVTFERGAALMGLQPVLFAPETLDKPEAPKDVLGYLASWVDVVVVRHPDIARLEALAACDLVPVVNAMTDVNHPCEVLSDAYALSRVRPELRALNIVFVGADGNIARAWAELAAVLSLELLQCCPRELATPGLAWTGDIQAAMCGAEVVVTDGVGAHGDALAPFQITFDLLGLAAPDVLLNPCPPFTRGREVSAEGVDRSEAFVGYGFKATLLPVQQAVLAYCTDRQR